MVCDISIMQRVAACIIHYRLHSAVEKAPIFLSERPRNFQTDAVDLNYYFSVSWRSQSDDRKHVLRPVRLNIPTR
jgi:hypothetical protein